VIARPRPARRPGLSLLEVLLALAIFLLALAAIGGLVNYGSERAMAASLQAAGTRLAQSKLAEVEAGVIPVSTGGTGTFDEEPDWNWSVEPGSTSVPNVYPVTVRVWRDVGGQHYEVVLTQMVFDPTQMGQATPAQPPQTSTGTQQGSGSGTTTTGGTGS
jgi:general secretion pathway protein I